MRGFREKLREERGVTALFVALSLTMFFGAAALAVDLGMLATARAEAQNAADAAALAAAAAFAHGINVEDDARALAVEYATRNAVRGQRPQLVASDLTISGDTVRIRVARQNSRGNAVPTLFGRILGSDAVDISATAAAAPLEGPAQVPCLLPIAVPDRWVNRGRPTWDPGEGDYYPPMFLPDQTYNPAYIGYGTPGERLQIQPQPPRRRFRRGRPSMEPSRSFVWLSGAPRAPREVRARVDGCPDGSDFGYQRGDWLRWYDTNHRPVGDGLREILRDPRFAGQYFDDTCRCVRDRNDSNKLVTGGPRYRALPVIDPSTFRWWDPRQNFETNHFVGVFVERVTGSRDDPRIWVRVLPLVGTAVAGQHAGPLVKVIRLVE